MEYFRVEGKKCRESTVLVVDRESTERSVSGESTELLEVVRGGKTAGERSLTALHRVQQPNRSRHRGSPLCPLRRCTRCGGSEDAETRSALHRLLQTSTTHSLISTSYQHISDKIRSIFGRKKQAFIHHDELKHDFLKKG